MNRIKNCQTLPDNPDLEILGNLLQKIIREENDGLLKSKLNGFKEELEAALAAISETTEFKSDETLRASVKQIPSNYGAYILGLVGDRIRDRAGDNTNSGGKGAYDLAIAFAQLATYRDVGLIKMMTVLLKSGEKGNELAGQYQTLLGHNRDVYQRHLSFFHTPSLAVAQTMVHYYPPGHNNRSRFLYSFIKANGIREPDAVPTGHYVIRSKYWPGYYLRRSLSSAIIPHDRIVYSVSYNWGTPTTNDKIHVTKKSDGYYSFELVDPRFSEDKSYRHPFYTYVSIGSSNQYVQVSDSNNPSHANFIIIKYMAPEGIVVTIAEKDTKTRAWNGLKDKWAVYPEELTKSNKDKAPFILLTCKAPEEGSICPDWNK
ncbi:uncharacterized protein LOC130642328 [Hydractinia symbiolongicarpus]|uniref:uncharacterized protein LOC130642328 n=1 Tax=Hydractinia symbiolongicarpus TaxID=13093 RepID=UPI00254ED572|nr:uncharacterized protein LOC130642328 [Hydractinia symbiolongicarpus]